MCVNGAGNEKFNAESPSLHCSAHCQTEQQRICLVYRRELNKKNPCWSIITTRVSRTRLLFTCSRASAGYSWILDDRCQLEQWKAIARALIVCRWHKPATYLADISWIYGACHFACILTIRMHVEEERWCLQICVSHFTKCRENYNKDYAALTLRQTKLISTTISKQIAENVGISLRRQSSKCHPVRRLIYGSRKAPSSAIERHVLYWFIPLPSSFFPPTDWLAGSCTTYSCSPSPTRNIPPFSMLLVLSRSKIFE